MINTVRRVVAVAALTIVGVVALAPQAASAASKQTPRKGEGVISMVTRACGSSYGWQRVAADNGVTAASGYMIRRDRSYVITCYKPGKATKPATKPAAVKGAKLVRPLSGGWCSDGFGPRTWRNEFHYGTDLSAGNGTVIRAAAAGRVTAAGYSGRAGLRLWIASGSRVAFGYFHASRLLVGEGQRVRAGQPIAWVGSTGDATGPHLHLALRFEGVLVDPVKFYRERGLRLC